MERHTHPVHVDRLAGGERLHGRVGAEADPDQRQSGHRAEVGPRAGTQVIAVGVRDDRPIDACPGVDVEAARGAVEAAGRGLH